MKIFIINLKRDKERKKHMQKQLEKFGIDNYEFIEATDGNILTDREYRLLYDKKRSLKYIKSPLHPTEVACAHSHARIYKKIVSEKIPYTLILEDDVEIDERIIKVLRDDFLQSANFDWLQLDYPEVGVPFLKNWIKASIHYSKQNPLFAIYSLIKSPFILILSLYEATREYYFKKRGMVKIVKFLRPLYFTSAYIITLNGAKKLLDLSDPIIFAADMLPNKARILKGLKMRAVAPRLVKQNKEKFKSNITQK